MIGCASRQRENVSGIAAIVLAAGGSTRLGETKQLLKFQGRSLVRHAAEVALDAGCTPTIVVLGANAVACSSEVRNLPVLVTINPDWSTGMASSIHVGLEALQESGAMVDAVLFTLCDQPLILAESLRTIMERHRNSGARIVASSYENSLGVPALFAKDLFSDLLSLQGDAGARRVIAAHIGEVIAVSNDAAALDIDTPEDRAGMITEI
jgi:molybdenum cofactor cytidylyltransferase